MTRLGFQLESSGVSESGTRARAARFKTLHGEVQTPIFMPVGTQATVKAQNVESLEESGSRVLLANTYHLLLRPGPEVFRKLGGIHRFMNWKGSVLTDSGGFQIFSLPHARKMEEEGAEFRSYVDGKRILLTPELSIEMQMAIGSDIMMVLDHCVPSTVDHATARAAMDRTHRWAARSLKARGDSPQSMFGIVQGACHVDLRKQSAYALCEMPFDGFAIGGLAVGEGRSEREDMTELAAELLPRNLPRYLMGVGTPIDLLEAVHRGVDMFDCILPTAFAQQGVAFTSKGKIELRRGVYRLADETLDPDCPCPICRDYSRAYLHHLLKASEPLLWQALGKHNLYFYHRLMKDMRQSILDGRFLELYRERKPILEADDLENPKAEQKKTRVRTPRTLLGDYEVHLSPQGFSSIRQRSSGEIMHSVNDPLTEASRLYVEQPKLLQLATLPEGEEGPGSELVVWDVGLGAATNAMAALRAYEERLAAGAKLRPLRIVSFERDLDPLKLAIRHSGAFRHLWHAAPHELLKEKSWASVHAASGTTLKWELLEGDFLECLDTAPKPELVFYDPFSFKVDSPLWSVECFERLRAKCGEGPTALCTYSASTAVRASLLAAGFFLARGVGSGPKEETTVALVPRAAPGDFATDLGLDLLGQDWLERWERSGARGPVGLEERIRSHPQFQA